MDCCNYASADLRGVAAPVAAALPAAYSWGREPIRSRAQLRIESNATPLALVDRHGAARQQDLELPLRSHVPPFVYCDARFATRRQLQLHARKRIAFQLHQSRPIRDTALRVTRVRPQAPAVILMCCACRMMSTSVQRSVSLKSLQVFEFAPMRQKYDP